MKMIYNSYEGCLLYIFDSDGFDCDVFIQLFIEVGNIDQEDIKEIVCNYEILIIFINDNLC